MALSCSRTRHYIQWEVSLVSSVLWQLLGPALFFLTLTLLTNTSQVSVFLNVGLSDIFSGLAWHCGCVERTPQKWGAFLSAACPGTWRQHGLSMVILTLTHLIKVLSAGFLHRQVTVFPYPQSNHETQVPESRSYLGGDGLTSCRTAYGRIGGHVSKPPQQCVNIWEETLWCCSKCHLLISVLIRGSCLQQMSLRCSNGAFSIFLILSTFIIWNSSVRKIWPSPPIIYLM